MGTYEVRTSVGLDFRRGALRGGGRRDSLLDHGSPPDFLQRVWPGAADGIREDSNLGLWNGSGDDSIGTGEEEMVRGAGFETGDV